MPLWLNLSDSINVTLLKNLESRLDTQQLMIHILILYIDQIVQYFVIMQR